MLPSVGFLRIALIYIAAFGMVGCMGLVGHPSTSTNSPASAGVPNLSVSPLTINFGGVVEGSVGQQTVYMTNTGTASAKVTSATVKGSGFAVKSVALPVTIAAGDTASFVAEFAPGSTGDATGSLTLTTNAKDSPITISLTGTGKKETTSIAATPSSASFGNVVVGSNASQQVQLKVSGSGSVKISKVSTSGTGFSISGLTLPMTLQAGDAALFEVAFKPTAAQSETGQVVITSDAADSPLTIGLSGKGENRVVSLSVTPASLSFGSVGVGKSATKEVTVKSTGNSEAEISSVSLSGKDFSLVEGASGATLLQPGQELSVVVKFDPSKSGNESGTVTVASNASGSPTKISLSGAGTSAGTTTTTPNEVTQHVVTLQWNPSATSGVVGYYVYRGTQEGSYTKISTSVSTTSYADSTVQGGPNAVYFYVVTAVDSSGIESGFSNQVSVTIPNN